LKWPIGNGDNENPDHQQKYLFTSMDMLNDLEGTKWSDEKKNNLLLLTIDDMSRTVFQETMTAIQHKIKEAMLSNYPNRKHPIFLHNFADFMSDEEDTNPYYSFTQCIYNLFLCSLWQYNFILVDELTNVQKITEGASKHMCESMLTSDIQTPPSIIGKKDGAKQKVIDPHCTHQMQSLQTSSPNVIIQIGMSLLS
jgi:hypothetical protein